MPAASQPNPPARSSDPIARRRAQVLRLWRWALVMYAIALTVATHWPRLKLSPEVPASDKMIHMLAFAAATVLLWRSGLIGVRSDAAAGASRASAWLLPAVVALGWAALDEVSQGLPGLNRTVSWHDFTANVCGVIAAAALLWAMQPMQPRDQLAGPDRARARLFAFTFDEMFAQRTPWLIGMGVGTAWAIILAVARPLLPSPRAVGVFGVVVLILAAHALYLIYRRMFFRRLRRVVSERPCLECGAPPGDAAADDQTACARCGAERISRDYLLPPRPPLSAVLEASVAPAAIALLGVAALFAIVLLAPYAYELVIGRGSSSRRIAPRIAQLIGRTPRELSSVVDLTLYVLLIAAVVRMWRRRMAAYIDRGFRCRTCGHDLHGTPTNEQGEGQCGECGEQFVRGHAT